MRNLWNAWIVVLAVAAVSVGCTATEAVSEDGGTVLGIRTVLKVDGASAAGGCPILAFGEFDGAADRPVAVIAGGCAEAVGAAARTVDGRQVGTISKLDKEQDDAGFPFAIVEFGKVDGVRLDWGYAGAREPETDETVSVRPGIGPDVVPATVIAGDVAGQDRERFFRVDRGTSGDAAGGTVVVESNAGTHLVGFTVLHDPAGVVAISPRFAASWINNRTDSTFRFRLYPI